jgi:hypothetical protein
MTLGDCSDTMGLVPEQPFRPAAGAIREVPENRAEFAKKQCRKFHKEAMMSEKLLFAVVLFLSATTAAMAAELELPDRGNPDYVLCLDFEDAAGSVSHLSAFEVAKSRGIREGAGYKSNRGYSTVQIENYGIPPAVGVRFPRQTGITFIHYHLRTPSYFYQGYGGHGYYFRDSKSTGKLAGSSVHDPNRGQPAWFNPEWDLYTVLNLRGSGYHRITKSFEGFEPRNRGQWHSYQFMLVPSLKDPTVGRIKAWIDGELAAFCKHDTIPGYDTIFISHYWHSVEYVRKDTCSNLFESHTAPPHPAFELFTDNIIVSKRFIEFGPNNARIERVRLAGFEAGAFKVHFDTTAAAAKIGVEWGETPRYGKQMTADVDPPGYFHAVRVDSLKSNKTYHMRLIAQDDKGRTLRSEDIEFRTPATGNTADLRCADWKGEVYQNLDFSGDPVCVRNFRSLSSVSWPGPDSDDLVDTSSHMSVRYTKTARYAAGNYMIRAQVYDGIRVLVDGQTKIDRLARTNGHNNRRDIPLTLTGGEHTVVVEHAIWRYDDWEARKSKCLAFRLDPEDTTPPALFGHGIYSTEFLNPQRARYVGRWSESCAITIDYGLTPRYGSRLICVGHMAVAGFPDLPIGETYHYRVTATDASGNQTVIPDATFKVGDTIPPNKIMLSVDRVSETQVELKFKAPGEDGRHGTATAYDIRTSSAPISTVNWDQATVVQNVPAPNQGKTAESIVLDGFPRGAACYFAIQAIDNDGQRSLLSNTASDPPGPEVMDCDGDGYGVGSMLGDDPDDYDPSIVGQPDIGAAEREVSAPAVAKPDDDPVACPLLGQCRPRFAVAGVDHQRPRAVLFGVVGDPLDDAPAPTVVGLHQYGDVAAAKPASCEAFSGHRHDRLLLVPVGTKYTSGTNQGVTYSIRARLEPSCANTRDFCAF